MPDQISQVAQRIRELRELSDMSVDEMADKLNISVEKYRQYESGSVDFPVSFLYNVAGLFNIELSVLLTGESPKLHTYSVVRKGKGVSVERRKEYKYQNLAYNFANKKAEPFLVTVEPDKEGTNEMPFYSHSGQEFNYMLEGSMKVVIDNHEIILNEGDSLFFDSGKKHGMQALNGKPAKFLAIIL